MASLFSQIRSKFDDFEEFYEAVAGWGFDFKQLDRGRFQADVHQIEMPDVLISRGHFNRALIQSGDPPPGMRTFGIMVEGSTPFIWRKQRIQENRLFVFPAGAELDASSLAGFHVYTVSFSEKFIEEILQQYESSTLMLNFLKGGVLEGASKKIHALRIYCKNVFNLGEDHPESFTRQNLSHKIREDLLNSVLEILDTGENSKVKLPFKKRAQLIHDFESYLARDEGEGHTVQNLCQTLQVNQRTFHRVITDWFGVSPRRYLLARRLSGVHKELCHPERTTSISDVANRWGFWHMGKFAQFYRKQYGELPSVTLRKNST